LSSAVGGVELTPLDLASLYAALARGGSAVPLRALQDAPERAALPVLDPGAVALTRRALSRRDRPDFPERRRWTRAAPAVFWKTGTSFGHRDAWSAGAGARYTAAVWLGNFDNRGSVHLVGAQAAGPLLFDVLEGMGEGRARPPPRRDGLAQVEVCSFSGRLPGPACPHTHLVDALVDRVPTEKCPFHVEVEIALETGRAVTPRCRAGRETETRAFLSLPAEVRRWMREGTRRMPELPSFEPGCAVDARGGRPHIVTPAAGQVALLVPGLAADRQEIPLSARSAQGARLSWFVDGAFLGTVAADERLWWTPRHGTHRVVVTDDAGLSDERTLEVRAMP
jgi:penicillin-binding protein 1C